MGNTKLFHEFARPLLVPFYLARMFRRSDKKNSRLFEGVSKPCCDSLVRSYIDQRYIAVLTKLNDLFSIRNTDGRKEKNRCTGYILHVIVAGNFEDTVYMLALPIPENKSASSPTTPPHNNPFYFPQHT